MKRFILIVFLIVFITSIFGVAIPEASAASNIDPQAFMGKNISQVQSVLGKNTRIDDSEYGFKWYIYNKNYKRFTMVGVDNEGTIVAFYTNSSYLKLKNKITTKSNKSVVQKYFGQSLTSIQFGNTYNVISHSSEKSVYLVGDYYMNIFYDLRSKNRVCGVMCINKNYEEASLTQSLTLTRSLKDVYEKQSVDIINAKRAVSGLRALKQDSNVYNFAISRSVDMEARNYASHMTPEGLYPDKLAKNANLKFKSLGENFGVGFQNAILLNEHLMNSPSHRAVILNRKYLKIGVGVQASYSKFAYVTQILIK